MACTIDRQVQHQTLGNATEHTCVYAVALFCLGEPEKRMATVGIQNVSHGANEFVDVFQCIAS